MKKVLSVLALTTLTSSMAFAASDYTLNVESNNNQAKVTVLKDGQAVSNVPVKVVGNGTKTYVSGSKGTFVAANLFDNGRTFTFELVDDNGEVVREQRYLTSF
ncbi:hypothetical protein H4F18_07105 [Vibrio scophthalmi]|uniref:hypothetical protein n=1 Tax=Vibrio scophthalmi TaxID=45658 RepID=UPI002FEEE20C